MNTPDAQVESTPIRRSRLGDSGRLVLDGAATATTQRLMALGLTPGTQVRVIRVAPLGDPIMLETEDFKVILRKDEADGLALES